MSGRNGNRKDGLEVWMLEGLEVWCSWRGFVPHPILSGENKDRKDAKGGANRFGLHRSLCGYAADRARRPPFRALYLIIYRSADGRGRFGALRLHGLIS